MKITAFAATNSTQSINKQFVQFAANQFNASVRLLDLNDYEMPIYSLEREAATGIPQLANDFVDALDDADLIIVSLAEHNGTYTTAFKNIFDWTSRVKLKLFHDKPVFVMATSPGGMGGRFVLEAALTRFPRHGAHVAASFSLPFFSNNFNAETGIQDAELKEHFEEAIEACKLAVNQLAVANFK